jgi:hypothetical protein
MDEKHITAEFDGKFTVNYSVGRQISAIRVLPEFGRLIAAAPEMYEALRLINKITSPGTRTLDDFMRDMSWACDEARRVIAKAEGWS